MVCSSFGAFNIEGNSLEIVGLGVGKDFSTFEDVSGGLG